MTCDGPLVYIEACPHVPSLVSCARLCPAESFAGVHTHCCSLILVTNRTRTTIIIVFNYAKIASMVINSPQASTGTQTTQTASPAPSPGPVDPALWGSLCAMGPGLGLTPMYFKRPKRRYTIGRASDNDFPFPQVADMCKHVLVHPQVLP